VQLFIHNEPNLSPTYKPDVTHVPVGDTINRIKTFCIVQKGEFFHKIAMKYKCRVEDIVFWNELKNKSIYPGQTLIVWKPVPNDSFFIVEEILGKSKKILF